MTIKSWSDEELNKIYSSETFQDSYNKYCDKNKDILKLKNFLDSIQLNEKYFRLTTNNKIGKHKKFKNKNISNDTIIIKEINSYLNKLTDRNIDQIKNKIYDCIQNKNHLKDMLIKTILDKCIIHPNYNIFYIEILFFIYKDISDFKEKIETFVDDIYSKITNQTIDRKQSEYLQFCDKNKNLDLLIGHSLLVTELEKQKIFQNKINPSIVKLLLILKSSEYEEKNKCVQCLYSIFKSFYGDSLLPQGFIDEINSIIQNEKSMKIKFKLMDIIDRK